VPAWTAFFAGLPDFYAAAFFAAFGALRASAPRWMSRCRRAAPFAAVLAAVFFVFAMGFASGRRSSPAAR
jgi:hypothetical protein